MRKADSKILAKSIDNLEDFSRFEWSELLYSLPQDHIKANFMTALRRVQRLKQYLTDLFVGESMTINIRMLLAAAIAQEPVLFVGGPGLAKTELGIAFFESIGLRKPLAEDAKQNGQLENKYYEYLLSAFTVPEELFGPYRIDKLKEGKFERNNANMLTGRGVRGCFLDEVFKGSSNILNTMLTLINERRYFNDGVFRQSDLRIIIGAANVTPATAAGSFSGRVEMPGKSGNELMAFYDRFTVRLYFQSPETLPTKEISKTDFYQIRQKSVEREAYKLKHSKPFKFEQVASLNDLLLLSRTLFPIDDPKLTVIEPPSDSWVELFLKIGMFLGREESSMVRISPRKLTRLEKLAYALALLDHPTEEEESTGPVRVENRHCEVFHYVWESELMRDQLVRQVNRQLEILK